MSTPSPKINYGRPPANEGHVTHHLPNVNGASQSQTALAQAAAAAASLAQQAPMPPQMIDVSKLSVEAAFEALVEHALRMSASDLFITSAEQHTAVQVRHLGIVRPISTLRPDEGKRLIAHIRNGSGADVNERRRPADGRWIFSGDSSEVVEDDVDLRINFLPTMYGEDVAIRLLVRSHAIFQLTELGMTPDQLSGYHAMINSPSGLILITGPTGSGKTATLYASLAELNDGRRKINTIEDPVEYAVEGLHQSQTNPAIDLGFADLLRAVMRQSPDVIMIGEIRDEETARIAVRAANSGILVLATLHAPDAASAVQSMRAFGIPNHFLAASLRGIVSQRLVRVLDIESRVEFDLSDAPHTFDDIKHLLSPGEGGKLYAHVPTEKNHMTGYTARTGVFEVMQINKVVRAQIAEGAPIETIRNQARTDGMLPFRHAALLCVARGVTSAEELFRVIPTEQLVADF
jgi:type II secretory ATPase GspE/PulE/Tfp pilus assembly ATPase PilB-like protein